MAGQCPHASLASLRTFAALGVILLSWSAHRMWLGPEGQPGSIGPWFEPMERRTQTDDWEPAFKPQTGGGGQVGSQQPSQCFRNFKNHAPFW